MTWSCLTWLILPRFGLGSIIILIYKLAEALKIEEINKEFNESIYTPLNNLLYLRSKRDDVNALIADLENFSIPAHRVIIASDNDWLNHLKMLAHVPFNFMIRNTFNNRCSPMFMAMIHPEDAGNTVQLPRLAPRVASDLGFVMEADPNYFSARSFGVRSGVTCFRWRWRMAQWSWSYGTHWTR